MGSIDAAAGFLPHFAAVALVIAGVWLLRESWRSRPRAGWIRTTAGWSLIVLGLAVLAWHEGAEMGTTYALLALWGAGMAWTLADAKLLRATILLVAISAVSYGIAFLPKVLPS